MEEIARKTGINLSSTKGEVLKYGKKNLSHLGDITFGNFEYYINYFWKKGELYEQCEEVKIYLKYMFVKCGRN